MPGKPGAPSAPAPRLAASVILHRDGAVYLVERSQRVRFFPGHHTFPGGTLDKDEQAAVAQGPDASLPPPGSVGLARSAERARELAAFQRAAAREIEEEVGLKLDAAALLPSGRLVTPPFAPMRYDTQFFVARVPALEEPRVVDEGELASGKWWTPAEALAAWDRGTLLLPPPTLALLRRFSESPDFEAAARSVAAQDGLAHEQRFIIEFHPRIFALPLLTPTLPPATTTNTFFVASDRGLVVFDPGTPHEEEREKLFDHVRRLLSPGRLPLAVVISHHHADHWGSAAALKEAFGFEVLAHAETAKRLPAGLVDRAIEEGDAILLGTWPATGAEWRLDVLHTPGHAAGHVALRDTRFGALLVGDMLSGVSTILVDPEEGDMAAYLASLERLASLRAPILFPAHGFALPGHAASEALAHRRDREARVVAALAQLGPCDAVALVPHAYADTPGANPALAAAQVESILAHLAKTGRAARTPNGDWKTA